ncbi:MAG: hypothetical protein HQK91_01550 [Nitrospirae bacterium]|nr:hypothetical protein [Nitrospirota bacterium]
MKRLLLVFLMSLLLVSLGQTAWSADDGANKSYESPVVVSVGVTSWYPAYTTTYTQPYKATTSEFMLGPRVSFSYKDFFLGASWITAASGINWSTGNSFLDQNEKQSALNLILGYMFNQYVGLFGGYLYETGSYKYNNSLISGIHLLSNTLQGPGLGVTGKLPIGDNFFLYLNGSWMWATFTWDGFPSYTRNVLTIDGGLVLRFAESAAVSLGWKHQMNFLYSYSSVYLGSESFTGPTLSLTWSFGS